MNFFTASHPICLRSVLILSFCLSLDFPSVLFPLDFSVTEHCYACCISSPSYTVNTLFWHLSIEHCGWVVFTSASCSGCPGFISQPRDWLSWARFSQPLQADSTSEKAMAISLCILFNLFFTDHLFIEHYIV